MAMLFATIAISIDAMLPALPDIAHAVSRRSNAAQLVVTSFVFGMGIGTLFAGPLSDAFGRKRVIIGGALYALAAAAACSAPSLELLLLARVIQGIGIAAPRTVSIAMIRDMFAGRGMARGSVFVMMVFMLVPAIAPAVGKIIIDAFGWRQVFVAFVVFAAIGCSWLGLRQPETLAPQDRRPLQAERLWSALGEVLSHKVIVVSILVQTLLFGMLFGSQPGRPRPNGLSQDGSPGCSPSTARSRARRPSRTRRCRRARR